MECIDGDKPMYASQRCRKSHISAARTAMNAEYFVVNDHGQSEVVEHIGEVCPHMRAAVLSDALGVEAI